MFNWDTYWAVNKEQDEVRRFNLWLAEKISKELIDKNHNIRCVADFGCGYATTLFKLAETYVDLEFYGFDISSYVINYNDHKAKESNLPNLNFMVCCLPYIPTRKYFDLILCISTLHHIANIKKAIVNLYNILNPSGSLIFNYPNRYLRTWYIKNADDEMKKRFRPVIEGVNILSIRELRRVLGKWPRKFYSSKKENIYVVIKR